jgi:hypothetical protein
LLAPRPATAEPRTPPEHRRGPDQTFLTFPEWFLVFSPAEYATFVRHSPPDAFPFFGHIAQFWGSYRAVDGATRNVYPPNREYHVMIAVIGTSTTVEYGLRLAYETLVGRLTALTTRYPTTEEDQLSARVSQEYVDFIRVRPWYEFDFGGALPRVWSTSLWGPDLLRKWERKYALTTEYGVKAVYGWIIMKLTHASYGEAVPVTMAVLRHSGAGLESDVPDLKIVARLGDDAVLASLPRYEAFTSRALALAGRGVGFDEIAGNRTVILVSALAPRGDPPPVAGSKVLFVQPILTEPARQRVAYVVPVAALDGALRALQAPPSSQVEHVFDY